MKEIERKFLVKQEEWDQLQKPSGQEIIQGFLSKNKDLVVRIRVAGAEAWITIKGKTSGISRSEYEYQIPLKDAKAMLDEFTNKQIRKTRYLIEFEAKKWEVDVFHNKLSGLIIAEIELESEEEKVTLPPWVGEEVSHNPNYYNAVLIERC